MSLREDRKSPAFQSSSEDSSRRAGSGWESFGVAAGAKGSRPVRWPTYACSGGLKRPFKVCRSTAKPPPWGCCFARRPSSSSRSIKFRGGKSLRRHDVVSRRGFGFGILIRASVVGQCSHPKPIPSHPDRNVYEYETELARSNAKRTAEQLRHQKARHSLGPAVRTKYGTRKAEVEVYPTAVSPRCEGDALRHRRKADRARWRDRVQITTRNIIQHDNTCQCTYHNHH